MWQATHQLPKKSTTPGVLCPMLSEETTACARAVEIGAAEGGSGPPSWGAPDDLALVPTEVKRPMPRAVATTRPASKKILRGLRGRGPRGRAPERLGRHGAHNLVNVIHDQHVTGHGHEQHGQVGDGVAEDPHGLAPGGPVAARRATASWS